MQATPEMVDRYRYGLSVDTDAARTATNTEVLTAVKLLALSIKVQHPAARFAVLENSTEGDWMDLRWVGDAAGERVADGLELDTLSAETHLYRSYQNIWCSPFNYHYARRHKRPLDIAADFNAYLDLDLILES